MRHEKETDTFDKLRVSLLALGHFMVDMYANLLAALLPVFQAAFHLSYAAIGMLSATFSVTSTLIQPVFGYIADRYGKRWIVVLGIAMITVGMCVLYLAPGYSAILIILAMAGIGCAMFHPQATSMVTKVSASRKSLGMSVFLAGGNIGYAITPVLFVILVAAFGMSSLIYLMVPGLIIGLLIYIYAPAMNVDTGAKVDLRSMLGGLKAAGGPLAILNTVVALRAWATRGLITFIPLYFIGHFEGWTLLGQDIGLIGPAITLFLYIMAEAVGGIIGGMAADRFGKKPVVVWSLLASAPFLYLAFVSPDIFVWPLIILGGGLMYMSISPLTVQGQEMLPNSQGMAGGLTLGFSNGIGGLLVFVTGAIADSFGLYAGVGSLAIVELAAGILAFFLPAETRSLNASVPMAKMKN